MYEEEGAAPREGCGCPPTPSLYIGGRGEGNGPSRWIYRRGRRPGETLDGFGRPHPLGNLPPKPGGAAGLGVAPPPLLVT